MKKSSSKQKRIRFIYVKPDRTITPEEVTEALKAKERVIQGLIERGLADLNQSGYRGEYE